MSKKPLPEEAELEPSDGGLLLPVLPLRDVVVYPGMVIPLFVGRRKSIRAVEAAMAASKQILLLTQKQAETDDPDPDHIYSVGTISSILQLLEPPDGTVKVLVEGANRARVDHYERMDDADFHAGRNPGGRVGRDRRAGAFPARVSNSTSRSTRRSRRKPWRPCPASTMPRG